MDGENALVRADAAGESAEEKRAREVEEELRKADAKKRADAADAEKFDKVLSGLDAIAKACDALGKRMDDAGKRLDALEKPGTSREHETAEERAARERASNDARRAAAGDDDDEDFDDLTEAERERWYEQERDRALREGKTIGTPEQVAADARKRFDDARKREDADTRRRRLDARRLDAQARCDAIASQHGMTAKPPMNGESLHAYRCRLLRDFQSYSTAFRDIDLAAIADKKLFAVAERQIYADAAAASRNPDMPEGQMRAITRKLPSGHVETTWAGRPGTWMRRHTRPTQCVVAINTRPAAG